MKKLLLLLLVGSVGGALAIDRDAARDLLKWYDAARIRFGDAVKCAEPAFAECQILSSSGNVIPINMAGMKKAISPKRKLYCINNRQLAVG